MRFLVVFILIATSIALVYSAKTSGPSAGAKPPEAAQRQSAAADEQTQDGHRQIRSEQEVVVTRC